MNYSFKDFQLFSLPTQRSIEKRCLGENEKGLLVIFEAEKESPELRIFLEKILSAVNFDLQKDVLLLNITAGETLSFNKLCKTKNISHLLSFGVIPKRLGLNFEINLYRPFEHKDKTYLFAEDLQTIFEERQKGEKKRAIALWKALQALFLKA